VTGPAAALPEDEARRMEAVRRYDVLDTPHDGAFDRITALAARHFGVPISIVSIVDTDRIWFKSHHGLEVREIGRDPGLCASAILHEEPWIVEDARADPRTLANPLVAGEFGLRFYAGAPLTTQDGHNLGTLCVIDKEPRELSDDETATLQDMAAIVMDELELRLASRRVVDHEQGLRDQAERVARALQASLRPPELPAIGGGELAALYRPADSGEVGGDFYDAFAAREDTWVLAVGDVSGKGAEAAAITALARHTIRTACLGTTDPAAVLDTLNRAMFLGLTAAGEAPRRFCTVAVVALRRTPGGFAATVGSAGHPPGLLLRPGAVPVELDGAGGPPVGWYGDASFTTADVELRAGDGLVLYTDGLSEARTPAGMLGTEGIAAALADAAPTAAAAIAERLDAALRAADSADDAAALVMTVALPGGH
jgi:sigma-B regulation protein RsbU (phosphoserine phosphatase)